jgi:hypothetical protein
VRDWVAWHEQYDDPASRLSARLTQVKQQLAAALDRAPAGPVRLVSLLTSPAIARAATCCAWRPE